MPMNPGVPMPLGSKPPKGTAGGSKAGTPAPPQKPFGGYSPPKTNTHPAGNKVPPHVKALEKEISAGNAVSGGGHKSVK